MIKVREEELMNVTGGMKIVVIKSPKFIEPILRLIFKVKKTLGES
ncbi:MAG: stage V sporulation protein SpoVM [Lachnospiraceae bacterium]|nr:stage V sporulation protein SpoVM [Lachnospiraceae bacterium]